MNGGPAVSGAAVAARHLLDAYPLIRSRSADEACELVGRVFSPHHLEVRGVKQGFDVHHNRVALHDVALNVLSYGSEVMIDPGERGDFYMVQLPLRGAARLACAGKEAQVDTETLAVLHPHMPTRMCWSGDCEMLLLQVPRAVLQQRMTGHHPDGQGDAQCLALTQSRGQPAIGAWWQAALDLASNLDRHGQYWLNHPAACTSMEEFLLQGLASMLQPVERGARTTAPGTQARCVKRARDYLHAHAHKCISLDDVARAACVSPRTLEAAFRRLHQQTPMAYLRALRLDRVHQALQNAAREPHAASVTELAMQHGFTHMGRFAAYYRQRFGCLPSKSLGRGQL